MIHLPVECNAIEPKTSIFVGMKQWILLFATGALFSCGAFQEEQVYYQKPKGFARIDLPDHRYRPLEGNYPYTFEYAEAAEVIPDRSAGAEPYWILVSYPALDAMIDLLVFEKTDLGYNVIINNLYKGLIYENEIFRRLAWGDQTTGYIKNIREDGKIDVSLQPLGFRNARDENSRIILEKLQENGGVLHLSDSSDPMDIQEQLGMSKKAFKKAIGGLYRDGLITLSEASIEVLR